ncbi:MAG: hypothetical protein MRERC_16c004 [Mycoplasmataceae bacterium RC_NB112A]|nr:MAG: hypothetical protein MRERC_16c004 [Mycoplasmataceae bacterium RC_NB112A]
MLFLENNKFSAQNLEIFRQFTNLTHLTLYKNHFYGSLESLKGLTRLEYLTIDSTDIDSGLECLPSNLKKIEAPWSFLPVSHEWKVKKIWKELKNYKEGEGYNLKR